MAYAYIGAFIACYGNMASARINSCRIQLDLLSPIRSKSPRNSHIKNTQREDYAQHIIDLLRYFQQQSIYKDICIERKEGHLTRHVKISQAICSTYVYILLSYSR
jgi:hypothetical protein